MSSFQSHQEHLQDAPQIPNMDASQLATKNTALEKKLKELNSAVAALKELESTIRTLKEDVEFHLSPAWLREAGKDANNNLITMADITQMIERPKLQRQSNAIAQKQEQEQEPYAVSPHDDAPESCLQVPIDQIMSNNVSREFSSANKDDHEMPDDHYEDNIIPLHMEDIPKKYSVMVDSLLGPDSSP